MKKIFAIALLGLAMAGSGFATTKKPSTAKPISNYMRSMGLLYVETVDELKLNPDSDQKDSWDRLLDGIQDRIEITLSEYTRPSGDSPYYELLKQARYAKGIWADDFRNKAWMDADVICSSRAHSDAVSGEFEQEDKSYCDAAIDAAINPPLSDEQKQLKQDEATRKLCDKGDFNKDYCDDYFAKHPALSTPAEKKAQCLKDYAAHPWYIAGTTELDAEKACQGAQ